MRRTEPTGPQRPRTRPAASSAHDAAGR